ncbi:MAG TPA: hypothetical protein VFG50_11985 [Rhodothermales bacterium]|nr:hypothetical protein [Rhodothermales bacterium]
MAEHKHILQPPTDPVPISPANEVILSGDAVTFRWEAVKDVLEYRFQIAEETDFAECLLDEAVPAQDTSATISGRFPTDDETFFWRVLARTEAGWSRGERVESFVSGTPEQAALHMARPDDDRRLGPFVEMVRSGGHEIQAELTGSPEAYAKEAAEGVQHEGVETGQIMALIAVVLIIIIGMIGCVYLLYDNLRRATQAEVVGMSGYPELAADKEEAAQKLNRYGIIDQQAGVYQIPIDSAMSQIVQEASGRAAGTTSPGETQQGEPGSAQ